MSNKKFGVKYVYENKMELIEKVLDIHLVLFPPEENLHYLEKKALAYYILYGYNDETSKDIATELGTQIKKGYARNINSTLRKKGFLIKDERIKFKNHLSKPMQMYREYFINNGGKILPIIFDMKKWK